jgi:transcriptional regulator with XRE-family HTH domain
MHVWKELFMEFNEKLQQLRKEKELTQEQLADELFVSRTAISKWESGRGYPSIDSLKAISKLFAVTIDDLLSGEELITIAEADNKEKVRSIRDLVFGVCDCMLALLLFLPFLGQPEGEAVLHVSLLSLETVYYIRVPFIVFTALTTLFGIAELALQNSHNRIWLKIRITISLLLSVFGVILFTASLQPYAAIFVFCLLALKGFLLIKKQ